MSDFGVIRDAIIHLCYVETSLGIKVFWILSLILAVGITVLVVRRRQSRWHVIEAERELRAEREQHRRDTARDQERIDRILSEAFPVTVDRTRALG
jgi:hypothetical protein